MLNFGDARSEKELQGMVARQLRALGYVVHEEVHVRAPADMCRTGSRARRVDLYIDCGGWSIGVEMKLTFNSKSRTEVKHQCITAAAGTSWVCKIGDRYHYLRRPEYVLATSRGLLTRQDCAPSDWHTALWQNGCGTLKASPHGTHWRMQVAYPRCPVKQSADIGSKSFTIFLDQNLYEVPIA